MPIRDSTNNRILAANARAADVAEKAVNEILPVQQQRAYDAFRVQGISCIHYSRLLSGRKCICSASQKQLGGLLNEQGKASPETINQFLTGNMSFNVTPYNFDQDYAIPGTNSSGATSPQAPADPYQGVFDIKTLGEEFPFADVTNEKDFGDNGPVNPTTIDDIVGDFDSGFLGIGDVACPICFGTSFIGGYAPYHAFRSVLTVADLQPLDTAAIDMLKTPWSITTTKGFKVVVTLPKGAIGVDSFKVYNMYKPVGAVFKIDGQPISNIPTLLSYCDGLRHLLEADFSDTFTHLEMQFNLTTESVYFEFPKRPSSSDTSLLERMEPFQIIMSPNVPTVDTEDVITESQLGKTLIVQNDNPWITRARAALGREVQVRVVQPQEIYNILPKRGRIMSKGPTTNAVRDNLLGPRRT